MDREQVLCRSDKRRQATGYSPQSEAETQVACGSGIAVGFWLSPVACRLSPIARSGVEPSRRLRVFTWTVGSTPPGDYS